MIAYAYGNIKEKEKEKFIYRIIPYNGFIQILKTNRFAFLNPNKWDDPYEAILLRQKFKTNDDKMVSFEKIISHIYGSCWTFNYNTDFSWRVYAPKKDGVQIKIKIAKLYENYDYLKQNRDLVSFQIGKVKYLKFRKLREHYSGERKLNLLNFYTSGDLFVKRYNYRHEKEVRLLLNTKSISKTGVYSLPFDFNKLIESIMLDPRLNSWEIKNMKREIHERGFNKRIYRSSLYTPPKFDLKFTNINFEKNLNSSSEN